MPHAIDQGRSPRGRWPVAGLALALCLAGCRLLRDAPPTQDDSLAADSSQDDEPAAAADRLDAKALTALSEPNWVLAIPTPGSAAAAEPSYRWRHAGLEAFTPTFSQNERELRQSLDSPNATVAANAAIVLARLDANNAPVTQLVAAVRDRQLKLSLRQASAEMLGRCAAPAAAQSVRQLLADLGRFDQEFSSQYVPELHAELLRALARHAELSDPLFEPALASPSATVRLEAARLWAARPAGSLPAKLIDLRADPDARIRAAVIAAMARGRHPQAREHIKAALVDFDHNVRLAAIAALGTLGDEPSRQDLQRLMAHDAELIRAAAVAALAEMRADDALREAASDRSWHVRAAVAKALAARADSPLASLADELLRDGSPLVQQQMIESLEAWPQEQAGPLLLAALEQSTYLVRKTARQQLARRWPQAEEFALDASPKRRAEMLTELRDRWQQQWGTVLTSSEIGRVENSPNDGRVGNPSYVAPQQVVSALVLLAADDVAARRQAADRLLEQAEKSPLDAATVEGLAALVMAEPDALVWRSVLLAVTRDDSDAACRLACAAIGHPSPEVRRRACEHLSRHGKREHAAVLAPSLTDADQAVVRAAATALGKVGSPNDVAPLERLLLVSDKGVRVAAAVSLVRLGAEAGPAALERLALDADPAVRRQAALAMGQVKHARLTPTLIRLLDDQGGVRQAAMASLIEIAGRDVARPANPDEPAPSTAEAIRRWKQWHAGSGQQAAGSGQ